MNAEIITVGTEILLGNIVNTNAAYLARQCASLGVCCYYQSVVGDNEQRLLSQIELAMTRADLIILTGGLGPTSDDITKETVAKAVKKDMVLDEHTKEKIQAYFDKRGIDIAQNNWKQAYIPEGATVIDNENGTAPGLIVESGERVFILLPGPPIELTAMFEKSVRPFLLCRGNGVIYSQTLKINGIPESTIDEAISDLASGAENPTIAPYAGMGEVLIRVTASAEDEKTAKKLAKPIIRELKSRFGQGIFATNEDDTIEKIVIDLLAANDLSICVAESITGGLVNSRLISVPGASDAVKTGFITYTNKSKRRILLVKKSTLDKHGAVSEATVKEMLKGAAMISKADVLVATSGEAGPIPSGDQPVGCVYVGCMVKGQMKVEECHFQGDRNKIRMLAATAALHLVRKCVLEYYSAKTFGTNES